MLVYSTWFYWASIRYPSYIILEEHNFWKLPLYWFSGKEKGPPIRFGPIGFVNLNDWSAGYRRACLHFLLHQCPEFHTHRQIWSYDKHVLIWLSARPALYLHEMDQPGPPSEPQPTPAVVAIDTSVWRWMRHLTTHIYGPKLEMSNVHDHPRRIWDRLTYWLLLTAWNSLWGRSRSDAGVDRAKGPLKTSLNCRIGLQLFLLWSKNTNGR